MTTVDFATAVVNRTARRPIALGQITEAPPDGARRLLNVAVATVGLIAAAPLMAVIAFAVKVTSRGPVIYRQVRIGIDRRKIYGGNHRRERDLGGVPFTMYKFRTMAAPRPGDHHERWAAKDDPRITPVGRVLRKYRLDELPQLWNVLLGDMNVVGPRPEQPTLFASLRDQIPGYGIRQRVRPGITGRAQVSQHYDTCLDDVRRK